MGREQPATFYDSRMSEMMKPLETSRWRGLYQTVANLLPPAEMAGAVADLGCGTGRFAELLRRRGYQSYWGVDFSAVRIEEARRYVPQYPFDIGDLFDSAVVERFSEFSTFVVTEVLEHVERDVELLESLPLGAWVVLSVPSYDSDGHVRHFRNKRQVESRYGTALDIVQLRVEGRRRHLTRLPGAHRIYVAAGRRR